MMDDYQAYIFKSRYARWLPKRKRRETWKETVGRYVEFFLDDLLKKDNGEGYQAFGGVSEELEQAILNLEVMPSMRCLMTAGKALEKDNVAGYNCAYAAVDHPRVFDEIMYILMCGTGVGFSCERQEIAHLPEVSEDFHETDTVIDIRDSKVGWAKGFRELVQLLYAGQIPRWDTSKVRPAGAILKTFGGRASGPKPLEELFAFTIRLFKGAVGRKLNSLEVHDLVCKIADIVVVGGVRRSALISLSNLSDSRMRGAKSGEWRNSNPQRELSNNSACYTEKPDLAAFLDEWNALYSSFSGERGIFNRQAAARQAAKNGRRKLYDRWGCNPCSEIILRSCQFCNLSEVVVRPEDTLLTLRAKVRLATILGTLQSTLTDFRYLRKIWKKNCEEERLLGVSLTGIMDHPVMSGHKSAGILPIWLEELKQVAVETNKEWSVRLGISQSVAITCNKPSGTVSQLVDSASGLHSRYAKYYIRRVRADKKDPLCQLMMEQGFPYEAANGKPDTMIFSFPCKAPKGAHCVKDDTAIAQLELWKVYQDHWCEHKPSCTVYYSDEEFLEVGAWVFKHFDEISGLSFLPRDTGIYQQAPYEEIDKARYMDMVAHQPKMDWEALAKFENQDNTTGSQEMACKGNSCEFGGDA